MPVVIKTFKTFTAKLLHKKVIIGYTDSSNPYYGLAIWPLLLLQIGIFSQTVSGKEHYEHPALMISVSLISFKKIPQIVTKIHRFP